VSHVTDGEGSPCSMSVVRVGDFGAPPWLPALIAPRRRDELGRWGQRRAKAGGPGVVVSALRTLGHARFDTAATDGAASSPQLRYEPGKAGDPVNGGPCERPPPGSGLPPLTHASGVDR